jgi:hypothetical protein
MDPAVKVEYLPTRYEEYKKGWISGSEVKKVYHKTTIHNTKNKPCRIILTDALPISQVEKISVELIEPAPQTLAQDSSKISFSSSEDAFSALTSFNVHDDGKSNSKNSANASSSSSSSSSSSANGSSSNGSSSNTTASAQAESLWPDDFVTKNKTTNNIVWFKTVKAGEKVEMPFSYRLEWPQGQKVYVQDKRS